MSELFSKLFGSKLLKNTETDYTAFEVYPTSVDIPAGTTIANTGILEGINLPHYNSILNEPIGYVIPAKNTQAIKIRTNTFGLNNCDVIVDWGDGHVSNISDNEYVSADSTADGVEYKVSHTYTVPDKRYQIKICGKDYYNFNPGVDGDNSNLMCRIFDEMPIASHIKNLSTICKSSKRLFFINAEPIKYNSILNMANFAISSHNLIKAMGFKRNFTEATCGFAFYNCPSLVFSDLQLPLKSFYSTALNSVYGDCYKLNVDIKDLIPEIYDFDGPFEFKNTFRNCKLLYTNSDIISKLWNNGNAHLLTVENNLPFSGCDLLLDKTPVSWGGSVTDSSTNKNIEEELEETKILLAATVGELVAIKKRVSELQAHLGLE